MGQHSRCGIEPPPSAAALSVLPPVGLSGSADAPPPGPPPGRSHLLESPRPGRGPRPVLLVVGSAAHLTTGQTAWWRLRPYQCAEWEGRRGCGVAAQPTHPLTRPHTRPPTRPRAHSHPLPPPLRPLPPPSPPEPPSPRAPFPTDFILYTSYYIHIIYKYIYDHHPLPPNQCEASARPAGPGDEPVPCALRKDPAAFCV
jgi:hypothetical protein